MVFDIELHRWSMLYCMENEPIVLHIEGRWSQAHCSQSSNLDFFAPKHACLYVNLRGRAACDTSAFIAGSATLCFAACEKVGSKLLFRCLLSAISVNWLTTRAASDVVEERPVEAPGLVLEDAKTRDPAGKPFRLGRRVRGRDTEQHERRRTD